MKLNPLAMMRKEFDDTGIIFDPENNKAMSLNTTGVMIWESVEKGMTESQITETVVARYDVEPERAAKDVAAFLALLKGKGLLAEE